MVVVAFFGLLREKALKCGSHTSIRTTNPQQASHGIGDCAHENCPVFYESKATSQRAARLTIGAWVDLVGIRLGTNLRNASGSGTARKQNCEFTTNRGRHVLEV